jgi:hypothetical protein
MKKLLVLAVVVAAVTAVRAALFARNDRRFPVTRPGG